MYAQNTIFCSPFLETECLSCTSLEMLQTVCWKSQNIPTPRAFGAPVRVTSLKLHQDRQQKTTTVPRLPRGVCLRCLAVWDSTGLLWRTDRRTDRHRVIQWYSPTISGFTDSSFSVAGPTACNSLQAELRCSPTYSSFCNRLKSFHCLSFVHSYSTLSLFFLILFYCEAPLNVGLGAIANYLLTDWLVNSLIDWLIERCKSVQL